MAAESAIAAGDLAEARRLAERIRDLPLHREVGHVAVARLVVVSFLEGDWDGALAAGARFREGWERAGRPRVSTLRRCAHALATVHGLRGEERERESWLEVFAALVPLGRPDHDQHPTAFFDALLQLHRDRPDQALERLATPAPRAARLVPGALAPVVRGAVGRGRRARRHRRTRPSVSRPSAPLTADNPVASALADRAAALAGARPRRRARRGRRAGRRRVPLPVGPQPRPGRRRRPRPRPVRADRSRCHGQLTSQNVHARRPRTEDFRARSVVTTDVRERPKVDR